MSKPLAVEALLTTGSFRVKITQQINADDQGLTLHATYLVQIPALRYQTSAKLHPTGIYEGPPGLEMLIREADQELRSK
jgi:hypothetical protein